MLLIENIKIIRKSTNQGYEIVFNDERIISLSKRRTITGLLLLIKYHICTEEDLTGTNSRLKTIKEILKDKIDESWIQDRYGDANKPFSELWTEEMFSFIRAEGFVGNRQYVLDVADHEKLFQKVDKASRKQLSKEEQSIILKKQNQKCNFCGSILKSKAEINAKIFAKDRVTLEFDHRIPVDRGGSSDITNYQALCHYCNKCKRQMCYVCSFDKCNIECALVNPELSSVVKSTNENIADRLSIKD